MSEKDAFPSEVPISPEERAFLRETLIPFAERHRAALDRLNESPDGNELGDLMLEFRHVADALLKAEAPSRRLDDVRRALRDAAFHFSKAARLKREQSRHWIAEGTKAAKADERAQALVRRLPR